jgi:hypothetical protein
MAGERRPIVGAFLNLCTDLGVAASGRIPDLVRRSFNMLQHENVLFLALGHDYWFNPADQKAMGLYQAFLSDDPAPVKSRVAEIGLYTVPLANVQQSTPAEPGGADLPPLNLSAPIQRQIRSLWNLPELSLKKEVTGQPVDPQRIVRGGFLEGGAANYNLCAKALDLVADDFRVSGLAADLQMKLPKASATLDGLKRQMMVGCYQYLRRWWGDSDLTKIGLTPR